MIIIVNFYILGEGEVAIIGFQWAMHEVER